MSNIAITPISPLNLSTRPVVLPPHVRVTFKLPAESRKHAFLGADGQIKLEISKETDVEITTSKFHAICNLEIFWIIIDFLTSYFGRKSRYTW